MAGFVVLGLPDACISSLGVFLDSFELVRRQVTMLYRTRQNLSMQTRVQLLTPDGRAVRLAGGRSMAADGGLDDQLQYDLIHLPGFLINDEHDLDLRISQATSLYKWLGRQYAGGARISASGTAVFLLAEAGLLNGGAAAVGRSLTAYFRRRYSSIRTDHRTPVVEYGRIITASGLAADLPLLGRLIEYVTTPELGKWLSDITNLHQTAEDRLADDPLTATAQLWLEERFAEDVRIADLARAMSVSQQTLLRHFQHHLNISPQAYLRRMRLKAAEGLLLRTSRPITQIANLVGYNDVQAFRRVFREHYGSSPSTHRAKQRITPETSEAGYSNDSEQ